MALSSTVSKTMAIKRTKDRKIREHILQGVQQEGRLESYSYENCFFEQCSCINFKVQYFIFIGCNFKNCIFSMSLIENCIFEQCNFFDTIFSDCYLKHCKISNTAFLNCQVCGSIIQDSKICVNGTRHEQKDYCGAIQRLFNKRKDMIKL